MQPDTIILEKDWTDLTESEKQLLASLVANETEFRLLKKALRVSLEAKNEVPLLSPGIKIAINNQLATRAPVRKMPIPLPLKMVAAVFVLALASFVVWKWANPNQPDQKNYITKTPVLITPTNNLPVEKEIVQTNPPPPATITEPMIIQSQKLNSKQKKVNPITPTKNTPSIKNGMNPEINTLVKNDPRLLEVITEVY